MSPLTRLNSFRGAEVAWENLLATCTIDHLFINPRWQRVWWDLFGDGAEMLLLCLQHEGSIKGIAPLARRNGTISFVGNTDVCDYNDFLVPRGAESHFYSCILQYLDSEEWECLRLSSLDENSPTLAYLPALAREHGYSVDVQQEDVAPGLSLPDNWDAYLNSLSKKDRHELRRKFRRLYSAGEEFRYYQLSSPVEVEGNLEDFFALMRHGREDKHRFLTEPREQFFRKIAHEMAGIGIFKLCFLELKGERVAAAICFDYGTSRLLYNSGFNPAYGQYSVGLILKALCMEDAIKEGKGYFDFLRGSEPYKYDLGGKDRTIYEMLVKRN